MAPVRLGKREIDALTCPPGRRDRLVFDGELTGFCLRVTRTGTKVFLVQYRRGESVHRLRLGRYGDITPAQARKLAQEALGRIAGGGSPAEERRATIRAEAAQRATRRRQAEADGLTLGVLVDRWRDLALASRRKKYRYEAVRALRVNLSAHLGRSATSIDGAAAQNMLDQIAVSRGAVMARRTKDYARIMFGWALKRQLLTHNPFSAVVVEGRQLPRDRSLTDAELGEVWRAAGTLGWPFGPYLRVLMLTLQREGETAGMRWEELAPDLSTWTVPGERAKNGKQHLVQLAEPARTILRGLGPARKPKSGEQSADLRPCPTGLVFTMTGRTPISGFSKAKARLDAAIIAERRKRAAEDGGEPVPLVPWHLHDLRSAGVTAMVRLGVRWEVADRVLNHVQGAIRGVAAVYQRHDFMAERQAAFETWAAHIMEAGNGASSTNR